MKERAAKKKQETATDKAARITATATKWMAVFTFVLAFVGVGTLLVLKNQLKEMHSGPHEYRIPSASDDVIRVFRLAPPVSAKRLDDLSNRIPP
jgi:hypothetical protein